MGESQMYRPRVLSLLLKTHWIKEARGPAPLTFSSNRFWGGEERGRMEYTHLRFSHGLSCARQVGVWCSGTSNSRSVYAAKHSSMNIVSKWACAHHEQAHDLQLSDMRNIQCISGLRTKWFVFTSPRFFWTSMTLNCFCVSLERACSCLAQSSSELVKGVPWRR